MRQMFSPVPGVPAGASSPGDISGGSRGEPALSGFITPPSCASSKERSLQQLYTRQAVPRGDNDEFGLRLFRTNDRRQDSHAGGLQRQSVAGRQYGEQVRIHASVQRARSAS